MTDFSRFVDDFHALFTACPNTRVAVGIPRDLGRLPDPSIAALDARVSQVRALLRRADGRFEQELSFDDALDLDLARLLLQAEEHRLTYSFNGRRAVAQTPRAGHEIGEPIFLLFANDPRPAEERLADVTARLEQVPAYLDAMLARLDTPIERWVAVERESVEGLPSLFETISGWAAEVGFADAPRLTTARAQAEQALTAYLGALCALPTSKELHLGDETARRIVTLRGLEQPLEELHAQARDFLAEVNATVEELRHRLVAKYGLPAETTAAQLQKHLAERYRTPLKDGRLDSVLDRYQQERERILGYIRERDLFPVFEAQDMRIIRTPTFMEPSIPAGAMMSPPPFRPGVRTSMVYLTLSEELVAEHTELSIPGMMIHEGIPGHHLHLATAANHPSIVRRHTDAMDQAEGWTTMLEDYMLDMGYMGELTDEARFSGKRDIARIGARVAIDLFFMTGDKSFLDVGVPCDLSSDDPFVAAASLLAEVTGFVPGRVQAELNWYSMERGYPLSYLTGNRLVWRLKKEVSAHLAGADPLEVDRRFHRTFLGAGSMPVAFLRRVFVHEGLLTQPPAA